MRELFWAGVFIHCTVFKTHKLITFILPANWYSEVEYSQHLRSYIAHKEVADDCGCDCRIRSLADAHQPAEYGKQSEVLEKKKHICNYNLCQ